MNRFARIASTLAVVALVATVGFATLSGQPERAQPSEMKALVDEVRALRLTIERAAAHSSQAQVMLGRVQLQEARLATLSRQYVEARTRYMDSQRSLTEWEQRLHVLNDPLQNVTPEQRKAIDDQVAELKLVIARQQGRIGQLQIDESAAANVLSAEQQRWADFNERLDALERTIGVAASRP